MMRNRITSLVIGLSSMALAHVGAQAQGSAPGHEDQAALQSAARATCRKSLVLLGEASHGDGHSDAFKVALIEHLVSACGFNAVLFESSFYEFIPVARDQRQGREVSPQAIAAAVGGLWKFDQEVKPLFSFLAEQMNAGRLQVGGLDFQVGGLEQPYTNEQMFVELVAGLPAERARGCSQVLRSQADARAMNACASEIEASLTKASTRSAEDMERLRSLTNLRAWMDHVNGGSEDFVAARERAMFENLRVFIAQQAVKAPVKAIVWAHNAHAGRDANSFGNPGGAESLGFAAARAYGSAAYSLGITACRGEFRWSGPKNRSLPPVPADSLEARVCKGEAAESVLIESEGLRGASQRPAALLGHVYRKADWEEAFNGVLVLNRERAPLSERQWPVPQIAPNAARP